MTKIYKNYARKSMPQVKFPREIAWDWNSSLARYSHPLSSALFKIVHTDHPINIQRFRMLCTKYIWSQYSWTLSPVILEPISSIYYVNDWNKRRYIHFLWRPLWRQPLYCYGLLLSIYMNRLSEMLSDVYLAPFISTQNQTIAR